ncbi:MAG: Uma2 family endonuclease [Acidobacteriota bacterium]|nr:Uma2 family endonuclease [Acidobacteriota bacterium]
MPTALVSVEEYISTNYEPKKFCIADLCAIRHDQRHQDILEFPPLFTIEILSERDTFTEVEEKGRKYLDMGVTYVWTVDPETGRCYRHSPEAIFLLTDSTLRIEGSAVAIPMAELIARLTSPQS